MVEDFEISEGVYEPLGVDWDGTICWSLNYDVYVQLINPISHINCEIKIRN